MKKIFFYIFFVFLLIPSTYAKTEVDKAFIKRTKSNTKKFLLYSPDIYDGRSILEDQVYNQFGCKGKNISPKLIWKNPPVETKSFAITIYDKDAKTESGWWHWIIYNIPADVGMLKLGASDVKKLLPKGAVQAINDYGFKGYGGPCPPVGAKHNYVMTIYALDVEKLKVPKRATPAMTSLHINEHKIASSTIRAYYKRNADVVYKNTSAKKEEKVVYKKSNPNAKNVNYNLNSGAAKNTQKKLNQNKTSKNKNYNLKSNNKVSSVKKNAIVEVKE